MVFAHDSFIWILSSYNIIKQFDRFDCESNFCELLNEKTKIFLLHNYHFVVILVVGFPNTSKTNIIYCVLFCT